MDLLQGEHPQILARIGVGRENVDFWPFSCRISEMVQDRVQVAVDH